MNGEDPDLALIERVARGEADAVRLLVSAKLPRVLALATRMLGDSAPRMASQGSEQLLMFFSGIAKYAHDKPEKARGLLTSDSGR